MSDIRITVHLPNSVTATVRVEPYDRVIDSLRIILMDHGIPGPVDDYQLLKNNTKDIALSANFLDSGITNGDDLFIKKKSANAGYNIGKVSSPRTYHQLGILVLDGSYSMTETAKMNLTKAQSVNLAVRELLGRLKAGRAKKNFSFAVVMFGNDTKEHTRITELTEIDDNGNFNPLIVDGTSTKIYAGLEEASKYANTFLENAEKGSVNHSVIVLLMTDGISEDEEACVTVANRLKSNAGIKIACAYFGTIGANDADAQDLLKQICSDPTQYYKTTYDSEDLRKFFESSMSKSAGLNSQIT